MVVFSWGLHNPMRLPEDKGIAFQVNGYKHQGWVKITYNEGADLFDIELLSDQKQYVRMIKDVYCDELVDVIDNLVEKTADYSKRIQEQYKSC